ncbi:MAG TPA: right-handed parallel beta-helix repeat-containing protein [Planctomycetaceae bacterium]|nr:right-handed parallel beta-helix repeat-containing protein [Planctomycetaceae bacterium]
MGFLFERTEDITLINSGVYLREGSPRMISSTADATHFCNCKGQILIENCRFENMLDDATNVHGTYVEVAAVIDSKTVRVELKHFEQSGFEFAAPGDVVWFIHHPDPRRASESAVASVRIVNERFIDLRFEDPLPRKLAKGDVLENKTWNPSFTLRGSVARNHRARNIVLKTPLKTVIENNDFSSMMSAIFFRGETFFWFESGNVEDVLIRNNRFKHCAYSQMEHAVVTVTPRLGAAFDPTIFYDRNIRIEDNVIETFDNRIVWADRVDGLIIKGNTIRQTHAATPMRPNAHLFDFKNCRNVTVSGNTYIGIHDRTVLADEATKGSLIVEGNKGF